MWLYLRENQAFLHVIKFGDQRCTLQTVQDLGIPCNSGTQNIAHLGSGATLHVNHPQH